MKTNIKFRKLEINDLESYLYLNNPEREFHKYNGPYFGKPSLEELKQDVENYRSKFLKGEKDVKSGKMIVDSSNNELIGTVNSYWKSKETLWMEIGIVIFNENYWGKGVYGRIKVNIKRFKMLTPGNKKRPLTT